MTLKSKGLKTTALKWVYLLNTRGRTVPVKFWMIEDHVIYQIFIYLWDMKWQESYNYFYLLLYIILLSFLEITFEEGHVVVDFVSFGSLFYIFFIVLSLLIHSPIVTQLILLQLLIFNLESLQYKYQLGEIQGIRKLFSCF